MAPGGSAPDTPMADNLSALAQQLKAVADVIRDNPASVEGLDKERSGLVEAAEALLKAAEQRDPVFDALVGMIQFTVIRLFVGWKVFEAVPADGSISHADLAAAVGAEVSLITRLSRILVATGVLEQVGNDRLCHTQASAGFASPGPIHAVVRLAFDDHLRTLLSMPAYFDEYGRKDPAGRHHTIFAFAAGDPNQMVWEHMNGQPERKANFMASMVAMGSRLSMMGSYDFGWILDKMSQAADRALVADVGGCMGHALQAICQATPGLPMSRCVVEDLEAVVEEAKATATGELREAQFVAMDFHKEQPVKGENTCQMGTRRGLPQALSCTTFAAACMTMGTTTRWRFWGTSAGQWPTTSRLLIVEQILGSPPSPFAAANDIFMATLGGKERTLEGFEAITGRAGLVIAQVHPMPGDVAVVECKKAKMKRQSSDAAGGL